MSPLSKNIRPTIIISLCWMFCTSPPNAQELPDEVTLLPGYGYLLIRIITPQDARVDEFELTNVESGSVITTRSEAYDSAGVDAWLGLIALPKGHYSWTGFKPRYHYTVFPEPRKYGPRSPGAPFEIVPGVINYAGDWLMWWEEAEVHHDVKTIERLVDRFPEHASRFELYLTAPGVNAISMTEYLRSAEENSASEAE